MELSGVSRALFSTHEGGLQHINICFKIYVHSQRNKNHRATKIVASLELHQWFQKCCLLIPHSPFLSTFFSIHSEASFFKFLSKNKS